MNDATGRHPDRERAPADPARRALHDAIGYQLRQVSKQLRELQRQAQEQTIRPDAAETRSTNGARRGHDPD